MDTTTLAPLAERPGEFHAEQAVIPGLLAQPQPTTSLPFDGAMRPPEVGDDIDDAPTEFDWFKDESVIVERQASIAVYRNKREHVVIRAEGADEDEDMFIFLSTDEALKALISALQRELKALA